MAKRNIFTRVLRSILPLASLVAMVGCSGPAILDLIIPHSGYTVQKDIPYGQDPRQQLDIYLPEHASSTAPVIVFFYGGSWKFGSKDQYRFVGQSFASRGYVTVIADYRLYPYVYFPAFIQDSADALVWVHQHILPYGGDPDNMFVAGHSAGAYNAMMITLDDTYIKNSGGERSWIKGAIGIAGPYDFLPFTGDIKKIFSTAKDEDTQPVNHVTPNLPPMLLLTGDEDTDVSPKNSYHLAEHLRANHDPVEVKTYPGIAHIGIVLSLAHGFSSKDPALQDIDDFIHTIDNKTQK